MATGNAVPPPSRDFATTITTSPANNHCGGGSWLRESRRQRWWWTRTRQVQQGGHPSPWPRSLRKTPMVATMALQLSVVRLRTRSQGRGRRRWAVAALNDSFIHSLIFIQTDSLLSHKSYYIRSMPTPIYICPCRCSPICILIPPPPLPPPSGYAGKRAWEGVPRAVVVSHAAMDNGNGHSPLRPSALTPLSPPPPPWRQRWR